MHNYTFFTFFHILSIHYYAKKHKHLAVSLHYRGVMAHLNMSFSLLPATNVHVTGIFETFMLSFTQKYQFIFISTTCSIAKSHTRSLNIEYLAQVSLADSRSSRTDAKSPDLLLTPVVFASSSSSFFSVVSL